MEIIHASHRECVVSLSSIRWMDFPGIAKQFARNLSLQVFHCGSYFVPFVCTKDSGNRTNKQDFQSILQYLSGTRRCHQKLLHFGEVCVGCHLPMLPVGSDSLFVSALTHDGTTHHRMWVLANTTVHCGQCLVGRIAVPCIQLCALATHRRCTTAFEKLEYRTRSVSTTLPSRCIAEQSQHCAEMSLEFPEPRGCMISLHSVQSVFWGGHQPTNVWISPNRNTSKPNSG